MKLKVVFSGGSVKCDSCGAAQHFELPQPVETIAIAQQAVSFRAFANGWKLVDGGVFWCGECERPPRKRFRFFGGAR